MGLMKVNCDTFNHADFFVAVDVNSLLNDEIIEFLRNVTDPVLGSSFINDTVRDAIKLRDQHLT